MKKKHFISGLAILSLAVTSFTFTPSSHGKDGSDDNTMEVNDDNPVTHDLNDDHGVDASPSPSATATAAPSASPSATVGDNHGRHRGHGRGRN